MRIGLFGGSFNPPHVCHGLVTLWALETRGLDEVWWVPTHEHAFDKELAGYRARRRMCELATRRIDDVRISDVEHELGGESRTIDTVRELEKRRPDADFSLMIGSDILQQTDQWKEWDELVDRVELVVVRREGYGEGEGLAADFWLPDVSSTDVRQAIHAGERDSLEQWVSESVLAFIEERGLYGA